MGKKLSNFKLFLKIKTPYEDLKYDENKYICNCKKYNLFEKDYIYWEDRETTSDELDIINFIKNKF